MHLMFVLLTCQKEVTVTYITVYVLPCELHNIAENTHTHTHTHQRALYTITDRIIQSQGFVAVHHYPSCTWITNTSHTLYLFDKLHLH